jgi:hypothetical protein
MEVAGMRFIPSRSLAFVCAALGINAVCIGAASADFVTYDYRGNQFVSIEGEPGVFSANDRVTGRFTINCDIAHPEGTCVNLPYNDYFAMGAVGLESMEFSAGPASLPTAEGHAVVGAFNFSTDAEGQIVDWDIDLVHHDPTGFINVDTDNNPFGPVDSAAALGAFANVPDDPGRWKTIGRPGGRSAPGFNSHNRIYGDEVFADVCIDIPVGRRCATLFAGETHDVKGMFEHTDFWVHYRFERFFPEGGWRYSERWMSCQTGPGAVTVYKDHATLQAILDPNGPECGTDGFIEECDEFQNCEWSPWGFGEPTEVAGEWLNPINTTRAVVNHSATFYDPWSGMTQLFRIHCNENGADLMADGGFSIGIRDFPFNGFETQGGNNYWLRACNNHDKIK